MNTLIGNEMVATVGAVRNHIEERCITENVENGTAAAVAAATCDDSSAAGNTIGVVMTTTTAAAAAKHTKATAVI